MVFMSALFGPGPGVFAEFGEEFADAIGDRGVAFGFAGPPAFGGVLDQALFDLETITQPGSVLAGGEELGAAQVEVALARPFGWGRRQWPSSSSVLK
jgi:hypothetical protein